MAYQHLNRLRAHLEADLTPTERLVAWLIATELRLDQDPLKDSAFSVSQRRLIEETGASKPTLSRAINRLIELEVITATKSGVSTWAKTYRLEITCPDNCENLNTHNSPTELEFIAGMRHAETQNGELGKFKQHFNSTRANFDNPYKEIYKEKKKTVLETENFSGEMELGFIAEALDLIEKPSSDHETLKGSLSLYPEEVAKAALEAVAKAQLDSPNRVKAYLAQIATKTPKRLLGYVEGAKAVAYAAEKRLKAQEAPEMVSADKYTPKGLLDLQGIAPAITASRVFKYAQEALEREVPNFYPETSKPWLAYLAHEGKLTARRVLVAFEFEEVLKEIVAKYLSPFYRTRTPFRVIFEDRLKVEANDGEGWLENWSSVLSETEQFFYDLRAEKLEELKQNWIAEKGEIRPYEFFSSGAYVAFDLENPKPIKQAEAENRFLEQMNKIFGGWVELCDKQEPLGQPFSIWLAENFTAEDDFKEFLDNYPTRPDSVLNYQPAFAAWLKLRTKGFEHQDILEKAKVYWESVSENLKFAKAPEKWLEQYAANYAEPVSA